MVSGAAEVFCGALTGEAQPMSAATTGAMTGRIAERIIANQLGIPVANQGLDIRAFAPDRPLRFQLERSQCRRPACGVRRVGTETPRQVGADAGIAATASAAHWLRRKGVFIRLAVREHQQS